ncbi:MAG TPA: caspase family protein [Blastocatellia bacterium]|nr:caspase family protein [Blastocatellia bacterium]
MQNTRFNFRTPGPRRFLTALLIFALASPPFGYAQQPQQPQTPQSRILLEEDKKTDTAKQSGPRAARPELVLQTGVTTPAYNAVFSPDGRLLASMDWMAGSIKLWEIASGRELCAINLGARASMTYAFTSAFAFSSDSSSLFSVSAGTLRQWDARTGRQLRSADLNRGKDFGSAYFSSDARLLATSTQSRSSLALWEVSSGRKLQELKLDFDQGETLLAFALSPDGRTLATNVESRANFANMDILTLRDAASGRVIQTIKISEQKMGQNTLAAGMSGAPVRAIRFSPDGRAVGVVFNDVSQIISGGRMRDTGRMNKVRMWEVSGGRELISADAGYEQNTGSSDQMLNAAMPNTFAFSNDNRQFAVASGNTIKLFDPAAGRNLATIMGHTSGVIAIGFSADGKLLATTSLDSTIKIWDVSATATGRVELAQTLNGMALPVESAAFSADGRVMAMSGADTVNIWELNTGAALRTISMPAVPLGLDDLIHPSPSFISAGGQFIAAKSGANEVKLWETHTGREVKNFRLPQGKKFIGGGVSPDGKWVALAEGRLDPDSTSGSANPAANPPGFPASTAQTNAPQPAQGFPQFPQIMIPTAPPDSTGDPKKDEKARRKASEEQMKAIEKQQREMMEQMMRGDKKDKKDKKDKNNPPQMQIGGMDMTQLQKMAEQAEKAMASGDLGKVMEMASQLGGGIAPGTPLAAMYQPSINVNLWDVNATGQPRLFYSQMKPFLPGSSSAIAFNNDGSLLASADGARSIKIKETSSGRELFTLTPERTTQIDTLAWSSDGRMLASSHPETPPGVNLNNIDSVESFTGLFRYSIRLWDMGAGRELRNLIGHTGSIRATAFSPDSRLLASGGDDAVVRLWETATGRELATLNGHSLAVKAVAFSPDGKLLVSGGEDGSARLWDVSRGEALATLVTLNGGADWLVVTPDGLFDGTPGAWGQILWRFNPNNIFDVAPVEIFFNEFFYPGLLADIVSGKRPRAAQDVALKDRRQPIVNLSRTDGQGVAGRTIKVKIEVSEPASANQATPVGARDVRLFRNGTLVKFWRGDALKGQKQATLEAEVTATAGENRLTAYAFNRDGVKSSDALLTVTGDASLRRKGVAYVLACGVNQYANAQYNLKYAVADATSFAEEIRAQQTKLQEYERVEIISLHDKDATKANILLALKRLSNAQAALPAGAPSALSKIQAAQPEDAVFIFFAGHGAAQGARFYLIPHDLGYAGARNALNAGAVQTILSRSVSDLELEAAIEGVDAGRLLFVLDACNSGQALEAEEKRRGPMNSSGLAQLAYEKGMYILTAAQSYQAALEAAQLGHGYLTFALIEDGLKKGLADKDPKDGQALAREWFNYATERVPQMQESEMQTRLLLDFAENEAKSKDPRQRSIQRPRVFYRRELEARPFVVAKP